MTGRPMCWAWYENAGGYRPWHARAEGCTCETSAHAPDDEHAMTCPVNQARRRLLEILTGTGDAER